jgi:hypothetical protein
MRREIAPPEGLEGLRAWQEALAAACRELGIAPGRCGEAAAAAGAAWAAVVMGGGGHPASLILERGGEEFMLSLQARSGPDWAQAAPPGLAPALVRPPAKRAELSLDRAGRAVWSICWEVENAL